MPVARNLHPSLKQRIGDVAETLLLAGTVASIWISVVWVMAAALLKE